MAGVLLPASGELEFDPPPALRVQSAKSVGGHLGVEDI